MILRPEQFNLQLPGGVDLIDGVRREDYQKLNDELNEVILEAIQNREGCEHLPHRSIIAEHIGFVRKENGRESWTWKGKPLVSFGPIRKNGLGKLSRSITWAKTSEQVEREKKQGSKIILN